MLDSGLTKVSSASDQVASQRRDDDVGDTLVGAGWLASPMLRSQQILPGAGGGIRLGCRAPAGGPAAYPEAVSEHVTAHESVLKGRRSRRMVCGGDW